MNSDVLLIPVTATQPDLVTQTDVVVYVPLASKNAHGIVRIGTGLNITTAGLLSLDETVVDNKLNEVKMMLTDHIADYNNPHRVTKSQVGLSNVDNTSDANKPVSEATRRELLRLENMISGARGALVYADYQEMVDALNGDDKKEYGVGQSIFIGTREVPDLWIYGVDDEYVEHPYVDDKSIETVLRYDGTIKIGYYVLAALESNEIVLDNVVTTDTRQTISAPKTHTAPLYVIPGNSSFEVSSGLLNYLWREGSSKMLLLNVWESELSFGTYYYDESDKRHTGELIVTPDLFEVSVKKTDTNPNTLKLDANGFTYNNVSVATVTDITDAQFVSYTRVQNLTEEQKQIARDNIGAGTGSGGTGGTSVEIVWWEE